MKHVWIVIAIAACSSSKTDKPLDKPADKPAAPTADEPAARPALVDKDLAKAGSAFAGWTAKGPADADVMEDLGGARIVTKKVTGFDLAWRIGVDKLDELKKGLVDGAKSAGVKVTFTTDTPDALVWTTEAGSHESYSFTIHQKLGGVDVTCYTVTPRDDADGAKFEQETCATLAKK